jgi:hypothetical protein
MHRVELKGLIFSNKQKQSGFVPNAPCGVESSVPELFFLLAYSKFLMHRVELKGVLPLPYGYILHKVSS